MIGKLLKDALTGVDNESYDNGRVLCFLSFMVYFGLAFANTGYGHPWSPGEFSAGIAAMAVGFGLNLRLKRSTEPGAN